jgi:serine/threonine protein kinase
MREIVHPNVVRLYEVFEDTRSLCLVLELCEGGELFDRIVKQGAYSEQSAAAILVTLCDALAHMHALSIVHRCLDSAHRRRHSCRLGRSDGRAFARRASDLKPENVLYASDAADAAIKITDFGMARTAAGDELMRTACGTPGYVAPACSTPRHACRRHACRRHACRRHACRRRPCRYRPCCRRPCRYRPCRPCRRRPYHVRAVMYSGVLLVPLCCSGGAARAWLHVWSSRHVVARRAALRDAVRLPTVCP